jgi:hypothetical protein
MFGEILGKNFVGQYQIFVIGGSGRDLFHYLIHEFPRQSFHGNAKICKPGKCCFRFSYSLNKKVYLFNFTIRQRYPRLRFCPFGYGVFVYVVCVPIHDEQVSVVQSCLDYFFGFFIP